MKKRYITAAVICLALAVIITAFLFDNLGKQNPREDSSYLFAIEESAGFYLKDNPGAKPTSNEDWVRALRHTDYDKFDVQGGPSNLELDEIVNQEGQFMTPSGQMISFEKVTDGSLKATAAGKDGEPGTADDISSASFRRLLVK